jgi:ribose transport system substrate-binding protein
MKRIFQKCTASLMFLVCLTQSGCNKPEAPPPPSKQQAQPKGVSIGISLAGVEGPWQKQLQADFNAALAKHPELSGYCVDASNDPAKQRESIEWILQAGPKLLIVCPIDAQSLAEPVAKAFDAGIPVIVLERPLVGGKFTCFITANQKQIGEAAGKWLAQRLDGKGKIVEIRGPIDSLCAEEIHEGFRAALKDPGYRFVFEGCLDPPKVDAAKLTGEALQKADQIDALFAVDDAAAYAAHQTFKAAGREKGVVFLGIGGLPAEGADYVKKHILTATVSHPTGGAEAIDAALKILAGQKVPKEIVLPISTFSEENVPSPSGRSKDN